MNGWASLMKAFGIDLSPAGVKAMLTEYGVDYEEIITLIPKMAQTLDDFNARLQRVENLQVQMLNLLNEGVKSDGKQSNGSRRLIAGTTVSVDD